MIEEVVQAHLARYPHLQIQDLYKLLHQAALGSEHAVSDSDAVERWLQRELAEMEEGVSEPLIDPISHNGEIVRVHLRPYVAAGRDPQILLRAFIRTADQFHGDSLLLEGYWHETIALAPFSTEEMDDFFGELKNKNFPAVHHSAVYESLYRPAYRVISRSLCPEIE